jgi:hypothetical protein
MCFVLWLCIMYIHGVYTLLDIHGVYRQDIHGVYHQDIHGVYRQDIHGVYRQTTSPNTISPPTYPTARVNSAIHFPVFESD